MMGTVIIIKATITITVRTCPPTLRWVPVPLDIKLTAILLIVTLLMVGTSIWATTMWIGAKRAIGSVISAGMVFPAASEALGRRTFRIVSFVVSVVLTSLQSLQIHVLLNVIVLLVCLCGEGMKSRPFSSFSPSFSFVLQFSFSFSFTFSFAFSFHFQFSLSKTPFLK